MNIEKIANAVKEQLNPLYKALGVEKINCSLHRKSQRLTLTNSLAKEGLWTYFSRKLIIPKKAFFCKEILQRSRVVSFTVKESE